MSLIYKVIKLSGNKGSRDVRAVFDWGASESFIRADIAKELAGSRYLKRFIMENVDS